ncbi:carbohydrate-binding module family 50 protein [Cucurbitaria berberidis CBS 394.84]|uniref:Carbohydrate-binding module family 50 protein n=1 Tax=Cucurbitaria berberidis CBS 394.84 TaxID=1168544 RepID=A0A9P4GCS8_9PLEO|nr:carbohydrate-binding module family 50 protein [Cucurbitaria berberidis CBS 394.84]KAF1843210.1 carbohydrate-binding module family 50 protein [Cucurbitaria berberidis CBS 394.84]
MDSDSERLPPGFERIGYDADSQTYTFSGPDGRTYESEPGCRYGELWPVGQPRPPPSDTEIEANNEAIKKDTREATRMMLPFALLIFVFLILVFKLTNGPVSDQGTPHVVDCAKGSHQVQIRKGDTCWAIAEQRGLGVDELLSLGGNEKVDCDRLSIGQVICVPQSL